MSDFSPNLTTGFIEMYSSTLLGFIPIIVVIVIIGIVLSVIASIFNYNKQDEEESIVTTKKNPEPHKQTYLEYVKERLAIERMMRA